MDAARGRTTWLEAGAGWPVVLLHAFPLSADMWRPQLDRVPESWRFIAPDLRGFGRSLPPKGGSHNVHEGDTSMDDYAADVLALMDGLEIESAAIGGLSMGGYVTFAMFREQPSRFTGMILADTRSQADTLPAREGRVRLRGVLAKDGPRGVADQMLPTLLLADISCATLVVVGDQDEITPVAEAQAMQAAIPQSTLCVIPDAGHLSSLEQPDAFSRALADFLLGHL